MPMTILSGSALLAILWRLLFTPAYGQSTPTLVPTPPQPPLTGSFYGEPWRMSCKELINSGNWPPQLLAHICGPNWSQDTLTEEDRKAGPIR